MVVGGSAVDVPGSRGGGEVVVTRREGRRGQSGAAFASVEEWQVKCRTVGSPLLVM
jgi:hypothetical protein